MKKKKYYKILAKSYQEMTTEMVEDLRERVQELEDWRNTKVSIPTEVQVAARTQKTIIHIFRTMADAIEQTLKQPTTTSHFEGSPYYDKHDRSSRE